MLGQAGPLGCPDVNGQPDVTCLCSNVNFGYGIRDCVSQACPSGTDTGSIITFGLNYCASGKILLEPQVKLKIVTHSC